MMKEKENGQDKKNVITVPAKVSGDITVVYRLLHGYSPEFDCFIYSLLLSLYENGVLQSEEYAFDIARDGSRAAAILDLAVRFEVLPPSFGESLEYILDLLG